MSIFLGRFGFSFPSRTVSQPLLHVLRGTTQPLTDKVFFSANDSPFVPVVVYFVYFPTRSPTQSKQDFTSSPNKKKILLSRLSRQNSAVQVKAPQALTFVLSFHPSTVRVRLHRLPIAKRSLTINDDDDDDDNNNDNDRPTALSSDDSRRTTATSPC